MDGVCDILDVVIDHAVVILSDGVNYGSVATYICDPGYELVGAANRTCQDNGTWSDAAPVCNGGI